jgi:hypothetical protein
LDYYYIYCGNVRRKAASTSATLQLQPNETNFKTFPFLCAIGLIGFAFAAPKWGSKEEERHVQGIDLLIAIDVSKVCSWKISSLIA